MRYPGLASHPTHLTARRFVHSYGAIISFEVRGEAARANAVCAAVQIIRHATGLGSVRRIDDGAASRSFRTGASARDAAAAQRRHRGHRRPRSSWRRGISDSCRLPTPRRSRGPAGGLPSCPAPTGTTPSSCSDRPRAYGSTRPFPDGGSTATATRTAPERSAPRHRLRAHARRSGSARRDRAPMGRRPPQHRHDRYLAQRARRREVPHRKSVECVGRRLAEPVGDAISS